MKAGQYLPMYLCRRNDRIWARDPVTNVTDWNKVVRVDHEPGHPVAIRFADNTKIVGDALDNVWCIRLAVLKDGRT